MSLLSIFRTTKTKERTQEELDISSKEINDKHQLRCKSRLEEVETELKSCYETYDSTTVCDGATFAKRFGLLHRIEELVLKKNKLIKDSKLVFQDVG